MSFNLKGPNAICLLIKYPNFENGNFDFDSHSCHSLMVIPVEPKTALNSNVVSSVSVLHSETGSSKHCVMVRNSE